MRDQITPYLLIAALAFCTSCNSKIENEFDASKEISYCSSQALLTIQLLESDDCIPNSIDYKSGKWIPTRPGSWTSGFWPGILWYLYEDTRKESWRKKAELITETLMPMTHKRARSHDSGFITMCSMGNGYRLTDNKEYKEALLRAADSLAVLYNPTVGTILSWPNMVISESWPHNTIIDNMMNLELLFWAAKNGGSPELYDIACNHAETTMKHGFRKDYTSYHVAVYDTVTGNFIKGVTHQGLSDESMWARGQAWGIYGYTLTYRETNDRRFLDFAQKIADAYLLKLPEDYVPYWDFCAPDLGAQEPRDASAAAITASALLELSTFATDQEKASEYRLQAENILKALSSETYQSRQVNSAFLQHSVGHMPRSQEVDVSIIYADYYYLEALIRLKRLQQGKPING